MTSTQPELTGLYGPCPVPDPQPADLPAVVRRHKAALDAHAYGAAGSTAPADWRGGWERIAYSLNDVPGLVGEIARLRKLIHQHHFLYHEHPDGTRTGCADPRMWGVPCPVCPDDGVNGDATRRGTAGPQQPDPMSEVRDLIDLVQANHQARPATLEIGPDGEEHWRTLAHGHGPVNVCGHPLCAQATYLAGVLPGPDQQLPPLDQLRGILDSLTSLEQRAAFLAAGMRKAKQFGEERDRLQERLSAIAALCDAAMMEQAGLGGEVVYVRDIRRVLGGRS